MKKSTQEIYVMQQNTAPVEVEESTTSHSRVVGQVMETSNYDLFHFIEGNRQVRPNKALELSLKASGIIQPIKVDKDFNIIDGQHRYTIAKKFGIPIRYISANEEVNYAMIDIPKINGTNRKWNAKDYIWHFAVRKVEDYVKLNQLIEDTRDIHAPIFTLASIAIGHRSRSQRGDSALIADGSFKMYNHEAFLLFIEDYRKFLRATGVQKSRDMLSAFFYLYTLKDFDLDRLITKVNVTNKAERLIGVRKQMVIVEILVDAYNHRLSTDSEHFIGYTISTDPKSKGEIQLTGEVSYELVQKVI